MIINTSKVQYLKDGKKGIFHCNVTKLYIFSSKLTGMRHYYV